MEMKNPPPMMTEKMPTTKPPTRSSAVSRVSSQGASALIHERSITVLHPDTPDDMHLLPLQRREPHRPPPPRGSKAALLALARTARMEPTLPVVLALLLGALLVWFTLAWLVDTLTLPVR